MLNQIQKAELKIILMKIQNFNEFLLQYTDPSFQKHAEKMCEGLGVKLDAAFKNFEEAEKLITAKLNN